MSPMSEKPPKPSKPTPAPFGPGVPEAVVLGPLLAVAEHLVRLGAFLELRLGVRLLVPVGVVVEGLLAERLPKIVLGHVPAHAEDFVVVALSSSS